MTIFIYCHTHPNTMITEQKLFETLKKWNFWERDINTGIERSEYLEELQQYITRKEIIVLKGIRRCGKSTIMRQLMKRLIKQNVAKEQILYLNLESYEFRNSKSIQLFEQTLNIYKKELNKDKKTYFFIDEIQEIPEWERFIRTIYDRDENIKFFISGSNASLLSKELSTLLTGRNITFEIKPLTYREYKSFTLTPQLEEYQLYGGFPEIVLETNTTIKKKLLKQYFEDIITKDVIERHKIRNNNNITNLAKYIIENSGTMFSINKLAKALKIDNEAVNNYLNAMKDAYLIIQVNHFSYSFKKRFDKNIHPKYYISDNGFFQIIQNDKKDIGQKFENLIAIELTHKHKEITYWLDKTEVDFIFEKTAINVTTDITNIKKREYQGLKDFKRKYKDFTLNIITPTKSYIKHEEINIINYEEFTHK